MYGKVCYVFCLLYAVEVGLQNYGIFPQNFQILQKYQLEDYQIQEGISRKNKILQCGFMANLPILGKVTGILQRYL